MIVHNADMSSLIKSNYTLDDLTAIECFFDKHDTLKFITKPNGLYSALTTDLRESVSGYTYTWVRDTIMISHYQWELGRLDTVRKTLTALTNYFDKHRRRFIDIIEGTADKNDPMQRPHIRFIGDTLDEVDQQWAHAENDALGYALWLRLKLANRGEFDLTRRERQIYAMFPFYFRAIEFWRDEDSGHWEETQKIESSSIGVVVAALEEMKRFILGRPAETFEYADKQVSATQLTVLIDKGRAQLNRFLPYESPPQRSADAALLFLIYPVEVVCEESAEQILDVVLKDLIGEYGIKRYLGDSYWCNDYKKFLKEAERTVDFSKNIEHRNRFLLPGKEAQWCIFDPIVSIIYGRKYLKDGYRPDLEKQTFFFNRSLAQITAQSCPGTSGKCPEAYYVEDSSKGTYVPNDHVPLAWTQANLGTALAYMKRSLSR